MNSESRKTIVVSAVNVVVGGTLTILQDCLQNLSDIAKQQNIRVVALLNNKELAYYDNIEYIELPWAKKYWVNRLWTEYVIMKKISRQLSPVFLWFSLHDTTPTVIAEHRAVYCHNSFFLYNWKIKDFFINYKVVMFALFTSYIYKKNIHENDYIVVQQPWFKDEFKRMFSLNDEKLIIAYPPMDYLNIPINRKICGKYQFLFPSSLGVHKNFEFLAKAAEQLVRSGVTNFELLLTLDGTKGKYDQSIVKRFSHIPNIKFIGFQSKENIIKLYSEVDCLVFPSKMESWGLPISEFVITNKPMLLSDLPYARIAAGNSKKTAFFDPDNLKQLSELMRQLIEGDFSSLKPVSIFPVEGLHTSTWHELLTMLLNRYKSD